MLDTDIVVVAISGDTKYVRDVHHRSYTGAGAGEAAHFATNEVRSRSHLLRMRARRGGSHHARAVISRGKGFPRHNIRERSAHVLDGLGIWDLPDGRCHANLETAVEEDVQGHGA